jgi:hypothetical protein
MNRHALEMLNSHSNLTTMKFMNILSFLIYPLRFSQNTTLTRMKHKLGWDGATVRELALESVESMASPNLKVLNGTQEWDFHDPKNFTLQEHAFEHIT